MGSLSFKLIYVPGRSGFFGTFSIVKIIKKTRPFLKGPVSKFPIGISFLR